MRNNTGGKKYKSGKKGYIAGKKELQLREESQVYGIVERKLGGTHFKVKILNINDPNSTETIMSTLRGSMRRRKSTNYVDTEL